MGLGHQKPVLLKNKYTYAFLLILIVALTRSDAAVVRKYVGLTDERAQCELEIKTENGIIQQVRFKAPGLSTRVMNIWLKPEQLKWEKEMSFYPWEWDSWEYWLEEKILAEQMVQGINVMGCAEPDVYNKQTKEVEFDGTCFKRYFTVFEINGSPTYPADGFDIFFNSKTMYPLSVVYFKETNAQNLYLDKPEPLYCAFKEQ